MTGQIKLAFSAAAEIEECSFLLRDSGDLVAVGRPLYGRQPWLTTERFVLTFGDEIAGEVELSDAQAPAIRRVGLPEGAVEVRAGSRRYMMVPCPDGLTLWYPDLDDEQASEAGADEGAVSLAPPVGPPVETQASPAPPSEAPVDSGPAVKEGVTDASPPAPAAAPPCTPTMLTAHRNRSRPGWYWAAALAVALVLILIALTG